MNIRTSAAILMLGLAVSSHAITPEEAAERILDYSGNRELILQNNHAKDMETLGMANAPDPRIEGEYLIAPAGEDNRWGVGIGYEFDWPGAYSARGKLGGAMRGQNAAQAQAEIYSKKADILNTIWTWLYADRRLDLMRKVAATNDSIRVIAANAARGGELSRLDISKIDIEHSRINSVIAGIENEKLSAEGQLNILFGGNYCNELLESIACDWNATPLANLDDYKACVQNNPLLVNAICSVNVADKNIALAKSERLPGFSVGYSHEYEDGMHFNGANIGVSIPLFSSRNKVKAAKAAKTAAEVERQNTFMQMESDVIALYNEVVALDKSIATPMAVFSGTDYAEMLLKAYRGGEVSLAEYLTELSWFYEAHLELMDLQYQREAKAAQLSLIKSSVLPVLSE